MRASQLQPEQWWKDAVIYQIYPRSFNDGDGDGIGDLRGIREKIDYLSWLGIDAVWLTPIYTSPNADWGYDISDYYSIDPTYGTMEEFDALLTELHHRDLRLIMDLVVNHTSVEHPWFQASLAEPTGPYADYYIWRPGGGDGPPNNWNSFFGGSAWEYRREREAYYLHLFATGQADLNWEEPAVRAEVTNIVDWWFDRGIDGFRMDVINMISKDHSFPNDTRPLPAIATRGTPFFVNGPELHNHIRELRTRALSRPGVTAIGECPGAGVEDVQRLADLDGTELDMAMHMELMELDHGAGGKWDIRPWQPRELADNLAKWQESLQGVAWPANFFSNHDQPRGVSRFGDTKTYRYESATMLAVLLLGQTGTPFIYYGEEIGMPNAEYREIGHYQDVDTLNHYALATMEGSPEAAVMSRIRYMSRDNARSPMQWTAGENGGFTEAVPWIPMGRSVGEISVEQELETDPSILGEYRRLLALRKEEPALRSGRFERLASEEPSIFSCIKREGADAILIIANLTGSPLPVPPPITAKIRDSGKSTGPNREGKHSGALYGNCRLSSLPGELAPYEAALYRL